MNIFAAIPSLLNLAPVALIGNCAFQAQNMGVTGFEGVVGGSTGRISLGDDRQEKPSRSGR